MKGHAYAVGKASLGHDYVRDSVAPARISGCYGEGGDDEREDESCADVVEVIVVEVD